jgi:hypothetical protein
MYAIMLALVSLLIAVSVIVAVSPIWVYWDATAKKIGMDPSEKFKYFDNMSAGRWSVFTLFVWIVGFPMYLARRRALTERARAHPVEVRGRWVKLSALGFVGALGVFGTVPRRVQVLQALAVLGIARLFGSARPGRQART